VVSHDVREISTVADNVFLLSGGLVVARGTPSDLQANSTEVVRQFIGGLADGPVPFHYPAPTTSASCWLAARALEGHPGAVEESDRCPDRAGAVTRFLLRLTAVSPGALLRFDLIVAQIFNSGALSLVIIMLAGLFVGMVLGLQGFSLLQRFGSEEALGEASAIGLVRELGP